MPGLLGTRAHGILKGMAACNEGPGWQSCLCTSTTPWHSLKGLWLGEKCRQVGGEVMLGSIPDPSWLGLSAWPASMLPKYPTRDLGMLLGHWQYLSRVTWAGLCLMGHCPRKSPVTGSTTAHSPGTGASQFRGCGGCQQGRQPVLCGPTVSHGAGR